MPSKSILTIVVPTYNRPKFIKAMLNEILSYTFDDINVHIYDSSSNRETKNIFDQINDSRVIYTKNSSDTPPYFKLLSVFNPTNSAYNLLVIDRDHVNSELIVHLVNKLASIKPFSIGYIQVREHILDNTINEIICNSNYDALKQMILGGKHPSGWLFSSDYIQKNQSVRDSLMLGENCLYPHELFISQSIDFTPFVCLKVNKQYSFGNQNNYTNSKSGFLYNVNNVITWADSEIVYPDFKIRLKNFLNLDLSKIQKLKIVFYMYSSMLSRCTVDAINAYKDADISNHYNIESNSFSKWKAFFNQMNVSKKFYDDFYGLYPPIIIIMFLAGINNSINICIPILVHFPRNPFNLIIKIYYFLKIKLHAYIQDSNERNFF